MGLGGEAQSLQCESSLGFVCPHRQGQLWEEEGLSTPRGPAEAVGVAQESLAPADPYQAIAKFCKDIPSMSIWETVETGNHARSLPRCHIAAAQGDGGSQVPPSPPTAPPHHKHWRCSTDPPWCTGQPQHHSSPVPWRPMSHIPSRSHPCPPARAEPSAGGHSQRLLLGCKNSSGQRSRAGTVLLGLCSCSLLPFTFPVLYIPGPISGPVLRVCSPRCLLTCVVGLFVGQNFNHVFLFKGFRHESWLWKRN